MPEMELSERAEEILAALWVRREERNDTSQPIGEIEGEAGGEAVSELVEEGLIEEKSGRISLTEEGEREAAAVVRRERLAERLLVDVINLGESAATEAACKFEHLLRRGIDDQICTLLGHPKFCPHGSSIPPGECCRAGALELGKVVSALSDLAPGQGGVVAYIHGRQPEMLQRMLAMGVVPGTPITLLQKFPSYVFRIGQGQLAVDQDTARDVYVRLTRGPSGTPAPSSWFPRSLWRRGRGRARRGR
ncbi:MAG: metal-dependent transcriptional regulator [Armatimonadota bacterium]|nr:MAG: metal-dependent transcriptional regulator [Armatimonadota bacterium]